MSLVDDPEVSDVDRGDDHPRSGAVPDALAQVMAS